MQSSRGDQEHILHRLEAFSDIVIALTLSGLAFYLQLPKSVQDVVSHPAPYIAFLASFAIVRSVWWMHNRLFAYFFYADALSIVLNFMLLASVVMLGVALQIFFKFADEAQSVVTYAGCLGLVFGLMSVLFAKGLRDNRIVQPADIRREGLGRARRCGIVCVVMLASLWALPYGAEAVEYCWLAALPLITLTRWSERRKSA
ncbi:MAG TPA: TMEM175 family protein [Candidatus Eremiobacteraceae bacterium]|nr:TMEM175 family protein [Candidatus Eremiobacteraceae bacterium]